MVSAGFTEILEVDSKVTRSSDVSSLFGADRSGRDRQIPTKTKRTSSGSWMIPRHRIQIESIGANQCRRKQVDEGDILDW